MVSIDFPEREYTEGGRTISPALVFIIMTAMVAIRADVHSALRGEARNFPASTDRASTSPPIQTRQSFQFSGSDATKNLSSHLERLIRNRTFPNLYSEEMTEWNDFVLQTVQAAPSYRYEYTIETPTEDRIKFSLRVFSGAQEIVTLENFNPVSNTVDVHVFLGMHMWVRDVPFEKVPEILVDLEKAREKCSRPFGITKKMTKIALRIAGCLGGITAALSKYGTVETEH